MPLGLDWFTDILLQVLRLRAEIYVAIMRGSVSLGRALGYSEKNGRMPLVFARPGRSCCMEHSTTHTLLTVL
ncbi:hypothetical protein OZ13_16305 [Xanthomonas cannabis pv. cannabis]|nr:hypothetical protein OZ10_19920 [Xanthomonas cannabis pv. cannabis]KHL53254.1 hypothetical protein OZ13_16305 [Xanthomonas cannabis pv. cannabis]